jgi:glutathione S-transferase
MYRLSEKVGAGPKDKRTERETLPVLRLLGRATSGNVQKVIWLLEESGQPYAREDYGRQFGNTQGAAYLKLHPNGKVPTLVDGDLAIWESNTILRYLASKVASPLYPADLAKRSLVERWMDWQLASLNGPYLAIFRDAKKPAAERGPSWNQDAGELKGQLAILEGALADRAWLAGNDLSLADICLGPIVDRCLEAWQALHAKLGARASQLGPGSVAKTRSGWTLLAFGDGVGDADRAPMRSLRTLAQRFQEKGAWPALAETRS